jgi:hypothetical protein
MPSIRAEAVKELEELAQAVKGLRKLLRAYGLKEAVSGSCQGPELLIL